MLQDLHSHTYYSFCSADKPEDVVETAIKNGLQIIGINDHNYGIGYGDVTVFNLQTEETEISYGKALNKYFDHINLIKEKYKDRITVLCGIEVCTLNSRQYLLPKNEDISYFDYCLVENLSQIGQNTINDDLFSFAQKAKCKVGVAHTDMFAFLKKMDVDQYEYFKKMAEIGAFWELNVNYDSVHNYREHSYVKEFLQNYEQQEIIKESGVEISIGFDGHKVSEYLPERVKMFCNKVEKLGIPFVFASKLGL